MKSANGTINEHNRNPSEKFNIPTMINAVAASNKMATCRSYKETNLIYEKNIAEKFGFPTFQ